MSEAWCPAAWLRAIGVPEAAVPLVLRELDVARGSARHAPPAPEPTLRWARYLAAMAEIDASLKAPSLQVRADDRVLAVLHRILVAAEKQAGDIAAIRAGLRRNGRSD